MDVKEKAQNVIDKLQTLTIPSTFENMNTLMLCLQYLCEIRDCQKEEEEKKDV